MCPKLAAEKELGPVIFLIHIPGVKYKHVTPGLVHICSYIDRLSYLNMFLTCLLYDFQVQCA